MINKTEELIKLLEIKGFRKILNTYTHEYVWMLDRYVITGNDLLNEKTLKNFLNSLK